MAIPVARRRFILDRGSVRHRRRPGSGRFAPRRGRAPRRRRRSRRLGAGCATSSTPRATGPISRPSSSRRTRGRCARRSRRCAARSTRTRSTVVEHGLFTRPREVRDRGRDVPGRRAGRSRAHALHHRGPRPRLRRAPALQPGQEILTTDARPLLAPRVDPPRRPALRRHRAPDRALRRPRARPSEDEIVGPRAARARRRRRASWA